LRLRPLTNTLPKPLISVAGKTMLARAFDHIKEYGISNIVVNTHYLAPLIQNYINTHHPGTILSHEDCLLETGGGIKKALPLLGQEPFFTLNGDNIWLGTRSLAAMKKVWNAAQMDALLLLIPREKAYGYEGHGDFFMSSNHELSRPTPGLKAPFVYIGVQLVNPTLFHEAPEGPFSLNLLWDKALQRGRLYGYVHQGDCFHISTPQDLQKYEPIILQSERE
ncbi:MAG: nucleotidyltransferase family protein, partial [Alphaproteobacteria bacterium]|nr:nucleotidyltransferase family protein [Alphaproteobacteria bacterium]